MTADMVEEIINYRQKQEIKNIQEIGGSLVVNLSLMNLYLATVPSNIFTIEASGFKEKPQAGYAIRTTINILTDNKKYKTLYYKTPVTLKRDETTT
jgi:hypothetical protein